MGTASRTRLAGGFITAAVTALLPAAIQAGPCDAYFPFDGSLASQGGGPAGAMIDGKGGGGTASFGSGVMDQALRLDGASAMRVLLDLREDLCPQVTITGWLRVESFDVHSTQYLLSTGAGSGPGLRSSGALAVLMGTGNGISHADAIRDDRAWFFFAGVYDYAAGTYRFHWRDRVVEGELAESRRPAEDAFWVGAYNDDLHYPVQGAYVDELRVIGRALTREEVVRTRGGRPGAIALVDGAGGETQSAPVPGTVAEDGSTAATAAGVMDSTVPPQLVPGSGSRFDGVSPQAASGSLPDGPTARLAGSQDGGDGGPLMEVPPEVADARSGVRSPELTPLGESPGDELREATQPRDTLPQEPVGPDLEVYRLNAAGPVQTIDIVLPGESESLAVTYRDIDGVAVAEGDIILGDVAELAQWADALDDEVATTGTRGVRRQGLLAKRNTKYLWPGGVIPYDFHANMTQATRSTATAAARTLTTRTNLTLRQKQSGDDNWVEFKLKDNDLEKCSSRVGMKQSKGSQTIKVDPECGATTLMHEILHAAGFWHEQSRPDRDQYVEILTENILLLERHNFEKKSGDATRMIGPYNFRSVMHYAPFNFGKECVRLGHQTEDTSDCRLRSDGSSALRTIRVKTPGATISRDDTLASDRAAINEIYRARIGPVDGRQWGDGSYGTAVAVGDVDGDGLGEIIVGRHGDAHSRFYVLDDRSTGHRTLATGPADWGANIGVTDVAVGDVDGDGRPEIGVTRRADSANRWYVYRYDNGGLVEIAAGGSEWGAGNHATAIAFGDADGDGRDEIAVGRRAGSSGRYYLFDDGAATRPFDRLAIGGSDWGDTHYTTDLDFGDLDNDHREELGVARYAGSGMRYEIVSYKGGGQLEQTHAGGHDWDSSHHATAIALGNIDSDAVGEFVVGRKAGSHSRFYVFDDLGSHFGLIDAGGDNWGDNFHTVGVALEDIDGDDQDEVLVARNAGVHGRYYAFDWTSDGFVPVSIAGVPLLDGIGATDIAAGDLDGNGTADLVISYDEADYGGRRYEVLYMSK